MKMWTILTFVAIGFLCSVSKGQVIIAPLYMPQEQQQQQQLMTPQQAEAMLAIATPEQRQAMIMDFWKRTVIVAAAGNQFGLEYLRSLLPVIRRYDPLADIHDQQAGQIVRIMRGGNGGGMGGMPVIQDSIISPCGPAMGISGGGSYSEPPRLCNGVGRLNCNGTRICRLCSGTGKCSGYGQRVDCTACHGSGACKFH